MSTQSESLGILSTMVMRSLRVFFHARSIFYLTLATPVLLWLFFYGFFEPQTFSVLESLRTGADVTGLTDGWYFTSVAVMTFFVTTAAVMVSFLTDMHSGRIGLHLSTGARPWQVMWGHIIAAWLVSFFSTVFVILVHQVWALAFGSRIMSAVGWFALLGGLALGSLFFAALNFVAMTFTSSRGSFGGYCFVAGSATGVLALAYTLNFRLGMTTVVGFLPFAQVTSLVRAPVLQPGLSGETQPHLLEDLLGVHIHLGHGDMWAGWMVLLVLIGWIALTIAYGHYRINRMLKRR
ncbi:MAG: ABC transporter permease [Propionibacteriaceae bacterium]|nr:ABC transporter permease [Propionibacteriaceae bacterium]